jgi:hypothetical protein
MTNTTNTPVLHETKKILLDVISNVIASLILLLLSLMPSFINIRQKITTMGAEFWVDFITRLCIGIFLITVYQIMRRMKRKYADMKVKYNDMVNFHQNMKDDLQTEQQNMKNDLEAEQQKMKNDQIWISSISGIIEYFRLGQINPESQRTMVFKNMVVFIYNKIRRDSPNTPNLMIYQYIAKAFSITNPDDIKDIVDNHIP